MEGDEREELTIIVDIVNGDAGRERERDAQDEWEECMYVYYSITRVLLFPFL